MATRAASRSRTRSPRRQALYALGGLIAATLAVSALIGYIAGFGELLDAVRAADVWWAVGCVPGVVLAYVGYIAAYREIARLDGGPALRVPTVARVVGLKFGAFLLGASAGIFALDYWALRRAGCERRDAARRILALSMAEAVTLAVAAGLCAVVILGVHGAAVPLGMTVGWIVLVPLACAAAAWVGRPARAQRLQAAGEKQGGLLGRARAGLAVALDAIVLLRRAVHRPREHRGLVAGFPLYWAGELLALEAALHAFGGGLAFPAVLLALATSYVITALPIPAGGGGGVLVLMLNVVGLPLGTALLVALTYRAFSFWLPLVLALAALPGIRRLRAQLAEVAREAGRRTGSRRSASTGPRAARAGGRRPGGRPPAAAPGAG